MSAVNEWIVREYFESLGYLTAQPRKYSVPGRTKTADEEVDFICEHPAIQKHQLPDSMVWSANELSNVKRLLVGVRGWHSERFYASTFEQAPDILRFVESDALQFATMRLGSDEFAKVLCLPRLPASDDLKTMTLDALKARGIDGVLCFRTLLGELIDRVELNRHYEKSDILQVIRLMKIYDFVKDQQLELFDKRTRS